MLFDREVALSNLIRVQSLPGSSLARDYLRGEGDAGRFYSFSPYEPDSFRRKWNAVQTRFGREQRERAARALRPTSERARERLARFVDEGGAVVTTGQQAGLFTGPLYTMYKALTAVRLAEALEAELGVLVLPVFWVASEDHDWEEANHAFLLGADHEVRRVHLPPGDPRPLPMSERRLGDDVITVLNEAAQTVVGSPFEHECLRWIRAAYQPDKTVAGAFADLVAELLAPYDVLLTDAADPQLKHASAPVLRRALKESEAHERLLARRADAVRAAGYGVQVPVLGGATNVFHHGDQGRERLYRVRGGFRGHDTGRVLEREEALRRVVEEPGRFSPNVLLRPVVESAVFPTLAYVAGPGEISYFAQLEVLFPEFGLEPPVVYPRASLTLVEPAVERVLRSLAVPTSELHRPMHELAVEVARAAMPAEVRAALDGLAEAVAGGYRTLIDTAAGSDPGLAAALGALRNESLARVGESERRVLRRIKDRESIALARVERARAHLFPEGIPQERVLNVLPFLARHGPELLDRIRAAIPIGWQVPAV